MSAFTLYWRDGKRQVLEGDTLSVAMNRAGYGAGSVNAVDFYANGDDHDYTWNPDRTEWVKNPQQSAAIAMIPCTSSQVESFGYDAENRTLAVQYKSGALGGLYHYLEVPEQVFENLKVAKSPGGYIHIAVKGGGFKCVPVPKSESNAE